MHKTIYDVMTDEELIEFVLLHDAMDPLNICLAQRLMLSRDLIGELQQAQSTEAVVIHVRRM